MRDKFKELHEIHEQLGVKFIESNEVFEMSDNNIQADYLFDPDHLLAADMVSSNSNKRQQRNSFESNQSKMRDVRCNIETQNSFASNTNGEQIDTAYKMNRTDNNNRYNAKNMTRTASKPLLTYNSMSTVAEGEMYNKRASNKPYRNSPRSGSTDSMHRSKDSGLFHQKN